MKRCLFRALGTAALLAVALLGSCKTVAPEGFVSVTSQRGRDFEALSADGAIFAITAHDSPSEAKLEFWAKATRVELVERRGYELIEEKPVNGKSGLLGRELWLKAPASLGDQRYLVTLFLEERWLKSNRVHVAEAAGPAELLEPQLDEVRKAVWANF